MYLRDRFKQFFRLPPGILSGVLTTFFEFAFFCTCVFLVLIGLAKFQNMDWATVDTLEQLKAVIPIGMGLFLGIGAVRERWQRP